MKDNTYMHTKQIKYKTLGNTVPDKLFHFSSEIWETLLSINTRIQKTHNGRQKLPSLFIIMEGTAPDNAVQLWKALLPIKILQLIKCSKVDSAT